ncbi:MAG: DNA-binding response regulator [Bacillota bacterium]
MARVLIIHSADPKTSKMAGVIKTGAEKNGYNVDLYEAGEGNDEINFYKYDLVIAGSPSKGIIKGRPADDIKKTLSRCKRTVGTEAMAYIVPSFLGNTKALRLLMEELEKLGCVVKDFASLKNTQQAGEFGRKL